MPDLIDVEFQLPDVLALRMVRPPEQLPGEMAMVIAGPPGPAGGSTLVPVGPSPLSGHSAVACDSAGELVPADCTLAEHRGAVLGVVTQAYLPGDSAQVRTGFPLEHAGWTWAPGPIYVGTGGQLTQALPAGALFSQLVGVALSATRVLIDLQPPITTA